MLVPKLEPGQLVDEVGDGAGLPEPVQPALGLSNALLCGGLRGLTSESGVCPETAVAKRLADRYRRAMSPCSPSTGRNSPSGPLARSTSYSLAKSSSGPDGPRLARVGMGVDVEGMPLQQAEDAPAAKDGVAELVPQEGAVLGLRLEVDQRTKQFLGVADPAGPFPPWCDRLCIASKSRASRSTSRKVVKSRAIQTFPFFTAETTVKLTSPPRRRASKTAPKEMGGSTSFLSTSPPFQPYHRRRVRA